MPLTFSSLLGALGLLWVGAAGAADQAQFGQAWTRNMVSSEKGLPDSFDPKTGKNIAWSAALGTESHSTPVVAKGRVLIGSNNSQPRDPKHQGDRAVLMCFDEKDGRFLWQLVAPKLTNSVYWDWPRAGLCSTVTVEGDRVYLVSNRGEVLCLDLQGQANGNDGPYQDEARHSVPVGAPSIPPGPADADILWLFDMIKETGVRQHDAGHASVLPLGPFLYLNTSNGVDDSHKKINAPEAPSLIVLDKATGKLVGQDNERIGPRIFHSTWSSPALAEVNGHPRIIFCGGDGVVYGFEPLPERKAREKIHSPLALEKTWQFDCDPDAPKENIHSYLSNRRQSPSTVQSMPVFSKNRVYVTVGGDFWWGKHQAWLNCIDATRRGDITRTGELWSYPLVRHSMSTPSIADGLVFVADCGNTIHCLDAETGQGYWTHEAEGEFWASTLVADGKVFVGTRQGQFLVLAAAKEKKLLSQIDLGSPMSATPVAANGRLYVATMNRLYAIALRR